ncbi:G patch domain and ankyrin repeat-containing protein 1 homolog [Anneissia japonica]|uniref:G patch domain and ankyrin repeat-containing protein 1 homolog n=1 Tax=Anneissia japonica TaxID=1529436 RepID=UPI0014259CF8|nr:G patch domain and ankyrin repeat-containing protein 1 homolog [Anneissia japonica]
MAIYQRILFQKARGTSVSNYNDKQTHTCTSKSTASDGNQIKDFYESVIAMETNSGMPKSPRSCSDVKQRKIMKSRTRDKIRSNRTTTRFRTANSFFKAAAEGDLKAAKEFVEQTSEINVRDDFGWTALMCACCSGHFEMVVYLLNHGAEWIGIKDKSGADAKVLAQRSGHRHIVNLFDNNRDYCNTIESNDNGRKPPEAFHCGSCNTDIKASTFNEHRNSTVHQFCMQHTKPSTLYYLSDNNKGYQMMLKDGWDTEKGLGPQGSGIKFPVKTILKRDRHCLGSGSKSEESRPRITHFKPYDTSAVKRPSQKKDSKKVESVHKQIKRSKSKVRQWEIEFRQSWNIETR